MTTDAPPDRTTGRSRGALGGLWVPAVSTALGGAALAGLGAVTAGREALNGALLGAALVLGFFLFGSVNTALVAAHAPRASLLVALLTYLLQVLALALVLKVLARSGALGATLDARWIGAAVITGALVWTGALIADAVRR